MGSFRGHAIPGSFFFVMGFWWSIRYSLKHVCRKQKRTSYFHSKTLFQRIEFVEGIVVIIMTAFGMIAEQLTVGGPHWSLYDYKEDQWVSLLSWHHFNMYFFFGLMGVSQVLCFIFTSIPSSLPMLMFANGLFVEAFIFYNHTHGREMLDIYMHQLLVLIIFISGLVTLMGFFTKNILLEHLRIGFLMFQGTWFWQIGFVLYPLSGGPSWNQTDHDNIKFLAVCFCWHYASSLIIVGVNYAFVSWLVTTRLKRSCPSEVGLLKNAEPESEEEM
ncbi:transmembrane protein 45A [Suncus etruscus]|uniref:transmembrane protein 45A n=1 Tax=Suncus etruscus TaxID=109475 RepID=UPI002110B76B|nr:transmembrane protein 45A [Suncus etruscus]